MRTPAQRKASAAYDARRRERGDKLVRVWLDKESAEDLQILVKYHGSIEKAIAFAIGLGVSPFS